MIIPFGIYRELNACYARLYGLTHDELRYTPGGIDLKEKYGFVPETCWIPDRRSA